MADEVRVSTRDELAAALARATSGTTILLAPGTYRGGLIRAKLRGTKERPIVLASADEGRPAIVSGGASGLQLSSPEYVELRNLVVSGYESNGLNIDDGGSAETPAKHVTLTRVVVKNDAPRGNRDGIKFSGVDGFRVENCTVESWGTGGSGIDFVGCRNGVVTGCTFRHRPGADFANGVQAKGGSEKIEVRRSLFENAGGRALNIGGSTGLAYFRPKPQGFEAKDVTVEDCTIVGSMSPVAFVGVDGATVRFNTIYGPTRWVVRILQENQDKAFVPCRNGKFENNLIAFRSDELKSAVNVGGGTSPETFSFARNSWICLDRPESTRNLVRMPLRERDGEYGVDPRFVDPESGDYSTRAEGQAGVRKTSATP